MHKHLKNIKHNKTVIDHSLINSIHNRINNTKQLKIIDGEHFICYDSDPELVDTLHSIEKKCTQYIEEKYSVSCNASSTYLLKFDKDHLVNFDYYNKNFLILQKGGNLEFINTSTSDIACIVFLDTNSIINFKFLSLQIQTDIGDIITYPLTYPFTHDMCNNENKHILLIHFNTLSSVASNDDINDDIKNQLLKLRVPRERTHGYFSNNTFNTTFEYNHGLLACVTSILSKVTMYKGTIDNIDTSSTPGFDFYKKGHSLDTDLYHCLFEINDGYIPTYSHNTVFSHRSMPKYYRITDEDIFMIQPFIKKYFSPSKDVLDKVEYYKIKYNICPENTVAVYFRGTDRYSCIFDYEIKDKPSLIIENLKQIQEKNPNLTILLQSDDLRALDTISKHIDNCITIAESNFRPSDDGYPVHYGYLDTKLIYAALWAYCVDGSNRSSLFEDGVQHAIEFMAFLILASQCKFVVTHVGHAPMWISLYRNTLENCIQL